MRPGRRRQGQPLRVAVFASGTGGNLSAVMRLASCFPHLVNVSLVVSDRPECSAVGIAEEANLPVVARDFRTECGRATDCRTAEERALYAKRAEEFHDRIDAQLLQRERTDGELDLIVLSYARWIQGRLLKRFAGRMINQHPGDLTLLGPDRQRALVGNDPVREALLLEVSEVRTSTFFVDAGKDSGPLLCQGPSLSTTGFRPQRASADQLELEMKRESDWPSVVCAVTLLALDAVSVDAGRSMPDGSSGISISGVPMEFGGLQLPDGLDHPDTRIQRTSEALRASLACLE